MQYHSYNPETRDYCGSHIAQPNPLEQGKWLIPAHSWTGDLPEYNQVNQKLVFNGDGFDVVTQSVTPPPVQTLSEIKVTKLLELGYFRDLQEALGLQYSFNGVIDTIQLRGVNDWINILGSVTQAQLAKESGVVEAIIPFRAESDTTYMLTPQEMINLGLAVSTFRTSLYQKLWEYKEAINNAKSKSAVTTIMNNLDWSV